MVFNYNYFPVSEPSNIPCTCDSCRIRSPSWYNRNVNIPDVNWSMCSPKRNPRMTEAQHRTTFYTKIIDS